MSELNPIGLDGIEFVQFASPDNEKLRQLFLAFGFSRLAEHRSRGLDYYRQGDIHFLVDSRRDSFAARFAQQHGPSIPAMGWRVSNAQLALERAVERGAIPGPLEVWSPSKPPVPSIYGIGESLIYFIETGSPDTLYSGLGFEPLASPDLVSEKGFLAIDHLTNNVERGEMARWANFYKTVFGFTEVRYFDIRGAKTGLVSFALRSPCGKFCIPINEGTEQRSQINEYLREYRGPGIQHLAFLTNNILASLDSLQGCGIQTLDIDDEYYETIYDRVPNVTEDRDRIKQHRLLIDGDEQGYLLQIFTRNVIGPIFIELIQRKNHLSFGEGNFGALFRSIERDQQRRGVLD